MFHLLLVSSNTDRNDPIFQSPFPCAKSNLLIQHQQSRSYFSSVLLGKTIALYCLIQIKSSQSDQFYMVVMRLLFSSMFHHYFLSASFKFHNYCITRIMLYLLLFFCLNHVLFLPTYIYIFSLYT